MMCWEQTQLGTPKHKSKELLAQAKILRPVKTEASEVKLSEEFIYLKCFQGMSL